MVLDKVGIDFMKNNEGIPKNRSGQVVAYQDERGIWTIGYGHTQGVYKGLVWSIAKAEAVFKDDVNNIYGKCVNTYIKLPMTQNQFNAMVDLCYNIGTSNDPKNPGFPQSQVCKKFNAGDKVGASKAFLGWIKPISLLGRRQLEIKLFNTNSTVKTPIKTTNNEDAVNKAKAQAQADAKAQKEISDRLNQQDKREQIAEDLLIKKYQLTRNQQALNLAKAKALTDATARKKAFYIAEQNRIVKEKANALALKNAYKSNNPIPNTINSPKDAKGKTLPKTNYDISKSKVLKSGFSIIGVILIGLVMYNAELPTTELE
jgi:lysozyme